MALLCPGLALAQGSAASQPLNARERAALFPSRAEIEQGRVLAESSCAACHGLDGLATDENLPHLAGQRTIYLYRELQAYKSARRSDESMRNAVQFLDDDTLLKAALYYASLTPPRGVESGDESWLTDDDPLKAVRAATAGCGACHGGDGNSKIPGMPSLTAQHPDYFVASMQAYQSGARTHNMMQMLVASLDDAAISDMGLFYALQEPAAATGGAGDVEAGRVAAQACASCHGDTGNASAPDMPTLAGQDATYLARSSKMYIDGQREHTGMTSAMAGFDDTDIANMAAFYASQTPVPRPVRKPLTTVEWLERCSRCHGQDGNSTDPRQALLAGQNAAYLERVLRAYANGGRSDSIMHAMADPLSDKDIRRIASYYAARDASAVVYVDLPCEEP